MFLAYIRGRVPGSPPEIGWANCLGCPRLSGLSRARGKTERRFRQIPSSAGRFRDLVRPRERLGLPAAERGQLPVDRSVCEVGWLPDSPVLAGGEQPVFPGDLPAAQVVAGVEVPLLLELAERHAVTAAQEQVGESGQVVASPVAAGIVDVDA